MGLRLPPPQLRLGVLRARAAPRTKPWPRGSFVLRARYLRQRASRALAPASGWALGGAALAVGTRLGAASGGGPHRAFPPARPVAEGGPPLYLQKEAVPERARRRGHAGQGGLAGAGRHRVLPCGAGGAPGAAVGDEGRPRSPRLADVAASPVTVRARNPGRTGTPATSLARSRARSFGMGLPIPVLFVTCPVTRDTDPAMPVSTPEVRALWKAFRVQEGFRLQWALMLAFSCTCNSISGRVV
ncbi:hypothetical protein GH733_009791 [Mirounga leonina]|nr:hypothetical protein GH733_009791 [Mirounga leonina]